MKSWEEKIARLQSLADVTQEQAEQALSATDGDLLESLLWLEREGIIAHSGVGRWSTTTGASQPEPPQQSLTTTQAPKPKSLQDWIGWIWKWLINNRLEAYKKYDPSRQIQCPIGALLGLICIAWYVVIVILVLGIFLGWRYRLAGPQLGRQNINDVVSWIDDVAEKARDELKNQVDRHGKME